MPLSQPTKVYQDDFSPARGNALQAAVASIFGLPLTDVPNFIESPIGYEAAIASFYQQHEGEDGGGCAKVQLAGTCSDDDDNNKWSYQAANVTYPRSPETKWVVESRRKCTEIVDSVVDDPRMTDEDVQNFAKEVGELAQSTLDKRPKGPHTIPEKFNDMLCILRGKSPRGDFGHVVVAKHHLDGKFEMMHDPHPDGTFLDVSEAYGWCLFFV